MSQDKKLKPPKMPELVFVEAMKSLKLKSRVKYICHDNLIVEIAPGEEEKVFDLVADIRKGVAR